MLCAPISPLTDSFRGPGSTVLACVSPVLSATQTRSMLQRWDRAAQWSPRADSSSHTNLSWVPGVVGQTRGSVKLRGLSQFVLCLLPCFPVKLRDFESAVNNFEKALERAKLVHNNEAQQAIISVSLCRPLGWGDVEWEWVVGPSAPLSLPSCLLPTRHRTRADRALVLTLASAVHLYSSPSEGVYLKQRDKTFTKCIHLFHVLCTLILNYLLMSY